MSSFWIYYIVCFVYCFYKNYKGTQKRSYDGVIGTTPGFDVLIIALLCWVLGPVDLVISAYLYFRKEDIKVENIENSSLKITSNKSVKVEDVKNSSVKIETK